MDVRVIAVILLVIGAAFGIYYLNGGFSGNIFGSNEGTYSSGCYTDFSNGMAFICSQTTTFSVLQPEDAFAIAGGDRYLVRFGKYPGGESFYNTLFVEYIDRFYGIEVEQGCDETISGIGFCYADLTAGERDILISEHGFINKDDYVIAHSPEATQKSADYITQDTKCHLTGIITDTNSNIYALDITAEVDILGVNGGLYYCKFNRSDILNIVPNPFLIGGSNKNSKVYFGFFQASSCGDGVIEGEEECDDSNTDSGDGCSGVCEIEEGWSCFGQPSFCDTDCGDSIIVGSEECEFSGGKPIFKGQETCSSYGFVGGELGCTAECLVDISGCTGEADTTYQTIIIYAVILIMISALLVYLLKKRRR